MSLLKKTTTGRNGTAWLRKKWTLRPRRNETLLWLRQTRPHPLRALAVERAASGSRPLIHLSGSGLGCHQIAISHLDIPRPDRLRDELSGLCAAGSVESGKAWFEV